MPIIPNSSLYREGDDPEKVFDPVSVDLPQADTENAIVDPLTGAKTIQDPDGGVTIDVNPDLLIKPKSTEHEANLAEELSDTQLGSIAEELLQGIDNDIQSRDNYMSAYDKGIQLMGLKLEDASAEISATGSISKVYHPLLIEATVRYQSNAMAELLPAAGPVKVRDDSPQQDQARVLLANDFERDFNHYLTVVAKEYYPDTDQLLFNQGWSGMAFKKVFECPIRKRPCSDLVLAPDLIVSNDVVDLETAARVTHRTYMSNAMVRRLQKAKVYRKVDLGQAVEQHTVVEEKVASVANIDINLKLPADNRHTIYEIYAELDIAGYDEGQDIPLPYCVTIDKDSRQILSIRRNWEKGDTEFKGECPFVKYGMIPALGFYDLGLVHLLGNTTRALTAILRMQLDAGQFSIFPGFLFSKQVGKQTNMDIRLSPGSGKEIETGGLPIKDVAMNLPYPGPSGVLATIADKVSQDGMRLGGASEVQVGEGRADVPVGTTMALIEQATKVMSAVHKRNHVSQQREFEKLRKLFNKNPEALWKFSKNPRRRWMIAQEFADLELIPASDPNIPSHTHRLMQSNAIVMMAQSSPQTFNVRAVAERALNTIGVKDAESLLAPPPDPNAPPPPPPPEIMVKMKDIEVKEQQMQIQAQQQALHDQTRLKELEIDSQNRAADRQSREKIEQMKIIQDKIKADAKLEVEQKQHLYDLMSDHLKHDTKIAHDQMLHRGGIVADHVMHREELENRKEIAKSKTGIDAT